MEQPFLFQLRSQVGTITFNPPQEVNAVNLDMAQAMGELVRKLPNVNDTKLVVLRDSGNHFMAGGDISVLHGRRTRRCP